MDYQHSLWSACDSINYLTQIVERFKDKLTVSELATLKEIKEEAEEWSNHLQDEGDFGEDEEDE